MLEGSAVSGDPARGSSGRQAGLGTAVIANTRGVNAHRDVGEGAPGGRV
jgi:hypothetical protein